MSASLPKITYCKLLSQRYCSSIQYTNKLFQALNEQDISQKVGELVKDKCPDHGLAEEYDKVITLLSLKEEKNIPARSCSDYSSEVIAIQSKVKVLKLHLSSLKTKICYNAKIQALLYTQSIDIQLPQNIQLSYRELNKVIYSLRCLQSKHDTLNRQLVQQKIDDSFCDNAIGKKKTIYNLKQQQSAQLMHKTFQKLQNRRNKNEKTGQLNQLKIPPNPLRDPKEIEKVSTEWELILSSQAFIRALLARNQTHFGQKNSAPRSSC